MENPQHKKTHITHSVDEQSINITGTPSVGRKESLRMLEQTLDTAPRNSKEFQVYQKVYNGVKKDIGLRDQY